MTKNYTEKEKKEYKNKQDDRIQNAYNKLIEMFTNGSFPAMAVRSIIEKQADDTKPSNNWSWLNYIIMLSNETSDARTFKQWQAVGRKVNKGAKAIYILAPNTFKIEDEETGEDIFITRSFRTIPVFRYEDTNGLELKQHDYTQPNHKTALQVAERLGIKVNYKPFTGKAYGFYVPSTKEITMMTNDEKTLWHELGHAVDDKLGYLAKSKEAEQETVAETVAAIMTQLRGIAGYEQHSYNYIKNYGSMQALAKLINRIFKIVEILLNEQDQVEKQAI